MTRRCERTYHIHTSPTRNPKPVLLLVPQPHGFFAKNTARTALEVRDARLFAHFFTIKKMRRSKKKPSTAASTCKPYLHISAGPTWRSLLAIVRIQRSPKNDTLYI